MRHGPLGPNSFSASPAKGQKLQDTPEWRRRLIKGELGYGDQKDLFSPIGLENIFQQPSKLQKSLLHGGKRGLSLLRDLDAVPSSPPPWPSAAYQAQQTPKRTIRMPSEHDIGVVDEVEETGRTTPCTEENVHERVPPHTLEDEAMSLRRHKRSHDEPSRTDTVERENSGARSAWGHRRQSSILPRRLRSPNTTHGDGISMNASRTVSGQTELEFSPVYISKHNTTDGRVDYAALDLSKSQLADRLKSLAIHDEADEPSINDSKQADNVDDSSYARLRSETLPEDLPVGTPDVLNLGQFVNVKRGGYSADGSFQQRPLSSSFRSQLHSESVPGRPVHEIEHGKQPAIDCSEPEADTEILPEAPSPESLLKTPTQTQNADFLSPEKIRSSGSPLKLFGNHDTFTSNKLYRRMSQLESTTNAKPSEDVASFETETSIERSPEARLISVEEVSMSRAERESDRVGSSIKLTGRQPSMGSSFGEGELDEYTFPEDFSLASPIANETPKSDRSRSPSPDARPPGSHVPFRFRVASTSEAHDTFRQKRKTSKISVKGSLSVTKRGAAEFQSPYPITKGAIITGDTADYSQYEHGTGPAEGKRPATSPCKHPTPKRRRTLVRVEVEGGTEIVVNSVRDTSQDMRSVIGQKRSNSGQNSCSNIADPDVLARRHILRPRNPTPSQRLRREIETEILEATEALIPSSPKLEVIQEHLAATPPPGSPLETIQARAVATEIAAFSAKVDRNMHDESRIRSVNTQDFLNEAMKIMSFIRNKGKPPSGLGNVEESWFGTPSCEHGSSADQSSRTVSRSPSPNRHESEWKQAAVLQEQDARVVSHLRKLADRSGEDLIASSRSIHADQLDGPQRDLFEGQTPNIRIIASPLDRPGRGRAESSSTGNDPGSIGTNPKTHSSHTSVESSIGRTIATNTSRKSENIATLNPGAVAHLIPDHVAGMSFDREKGIWVKKRSPKKAGRATGDVSSITQSDEDPFGNIPDLTVDDAEEINRTGISPSRRPTVVFRESATADDPAANHAGQVGGDQLQQDSRPQTREGAAILVDASSAPSKLSRPTSSESQEETRATSLSEQDTSIRAGKSQIPPQLSHKSPSVGVEDEVEHEIQINEGRNGTRKHNDKRNLHSIAISFSSPAVPRAQPSRMEQPHERDPISTDEVSDLDLADSDDDELSQADQSGVSQHTAPRLGSLGTTPRHVYRGTARRASLRPRAVTVGSISRIDERNELSFIEAAPEQRRMNLSLSVPLQDVQLTVPSTPGSRADVTFVLSDLPDFTVHQIDERELPERTLVRRDDACTEDRFEAGNTALVKALQDVEQEEPFWEDLRQVDLRERRLTSLHMLEVFCDRVEDLDVSDNELCQLVGVPHTVRHLQAQRNALTSLTSWGHLMNLQYLDVSGNNIDSLEGFCHLVHLRELRVDDNAIESLDGVLGLDGLLKLSLQRNKLQEVDFGRSDL